VEVRDKGMVSMGKNESFLVKREIEVKMSVNQNHTLEGWKWPKLKDLGGEVPEMIKFIIIDYKI